MMHRNFEKLFLFMHSVFYDKTVAHCNYDSLCLQFPIFNVELRHFSTNTAQQDVFIVRTQLDGYFD